MNLVVAVCVYLTVATYLEVLVTRLHYSQKMRTVKLCTFNIGMAGVSPEVHV